MRRRWIDLHALGKQFGKRDLDRVGFFTDPSPAPFDEYHGIPVKFREGIEKGRQMLPGPPSNLFEEKFVRIFHGEALTEPFRVEAQERIEREKAKIGGTLLPPAPSKKHATPGDYYGCFEKVTHFSPAERKKRKRRPELPNVKIKPNPLGGPGYADITINPFPKYSHEPYDRRRRYRTKKGVGRFLNASAPLDYFPPNPYEEKSPGPTYVRPIEVTPKMIGPGRLYVPFPKKPGGSHAGCFDKFPDYVEDFYGKEEKEEKIQGVIISGGPPLRTKYTNSIIHQVTDVACNATNYLHYREQVYPLE
ncbi:cilia-and flagella-associated protein 96 [Calliopsis andreniformis]|uniref:cilia-and flagella-associated protein 96 n=1 Tax=Calliopsis andreniformis TaxID=337506 RepID=UPI003FCC438C